MRTSALVATATAVSFTWIAMPASAGDRISEAEMRAFLSRCAASDEKDCQAVAKMIKAALPQKQGQPSVSKRAAAEQKQEPKPIKPPSEVINKWQTTFLIRDSFVPIAYITQPNTAADDLPQEGASFTYTHKFGTNSGTFVGKGAVMASWHAETDYPFYNDYLAPRISYVNIAPGIEFDTGIKNGKTFGQYSAIGAFEVETTHYDNPLQLQYWRAKAVYTTDFDQNAQIFGVESMWQPWAPTLRIGTMFQASEALDMYVGIFPTLNSDYYQVQKVGSFTELTRNQYWWVGPKVAAKVIFASGFLKPLSFYANYNYLYDVINGNSTTATFFRGGVKYQITKEIGLEGRYTTGRQPRTLEQVDEFYAGLTLKVGELR